MENEHLKPLVENLSPIYIKYYFISLIFFAFAIVYSWFSSQHQSLGFFQSLALIIVAPPIGALGAYLGEKFREFAKPDVIRTKNTAELVKAKLFWKFGPQIIGWLIAVMILGNIIG